MKIAIITDIHCTRGAETGFDVRPLVAEFVEFATGESADLLIDLGDRIDDVDPKNDLGTLSELAEIFARFPRQRVHLLGNHDIVNLTPEDHARIFKQPTGHRVFDMGAFRILVWEPSVRFSRHEGFPPAAPDLPWLKDILESDERPAIIVSHIPVSGAAMTGNYYFENNPDFATYPDHAIVRQTIAETGRAAIWISGHVHWNSIADVGGTFHVTLQSASETFTTAGQPAGAFALLEINDGKARLQVRGLEPFAVEVPFDLPRSWPEPRPRVSRQ